MKTNCHNKAKIRNTITKYSKTNEILYFNTKHVANFLFISRSQIADESNICTDEVSIRLIVIERIHTHTERMEQ